MRCFVNDQRRPGSLGYPQVGDSFAIVCQHVLRGEKACTLKEPRAKVHSFIFGVHESKPFLTIRFLEVAGYFKFPIFVLFIKNLAHGLKVAGNVTLEIGLFSQLREEEGVVVEAVAGFHVLACNRGHFSCIAELLLDNALLVGGAASTPEPPASRGNTGCPEISISTGHLLKS
jgi:hypothetical protein